MATFREKKEQITIKSSQINLSENMSENETTKLVNHVSVQTEDVKVINEPIHVSTQTEVATKQKENKINAKDISIQTVELMTRKERDLTVLFELSKEKIAELHESLNKHVKNESDLQARINKLEQSMEMYAAAEKRATGKYRFNRSWKK